MFERVYAARRRPRTVLPGSTLVSVGLHGAALGILALAGHSVTDVAQTLSEGIVFLAPPPAALAGPNAMEERVTFAPLPGHLGDAALEGDPNAFSDGPLPGTGVPAGGDAGDEAEPSFDVTANLNLFEIDRDSVFLASQVDNPAAYDARSAAPIYPDSLRLAGVEGSVTVQFVVDTTGHIELPTFVLLESTHGRFTESVREALPRMLFRPAELRGQKIKQLVQIPFIFRIQPTGLDSAPRDTSAAPDSTLAAHDTTFEPDSGRF
ncbi:MAG TPA: energy transducer TonB [Gemmatimonadaceae bacterium]|nr:energy transducer TonB [Gemmatimonadaceae bacterium]